MLEQVVGIAEVVGAVGVILSLLYVGRQLQQTNAMSRAAARQAMSAQFNEWAMGVATSEDLAPALVKVTFRGLERDAATELERIRIGYAYAAIVEQVHMAWQHERDGILTTEETNALYAPNGTLFDRPYLISIWAVLRENFSEDFANWFEKKYALTQSNQRAE